MQFNSPCMKCEKREVGCHDHCEEYMKMKEEYEAKKAEILSIKNAEYVANSVSIAGIKRVKKTRRKK